MRLPTRLASFEENLGHTDRRVVPFRGVQFSTIHDCNHPVESLKIFDE